MGKDYTPEQLNIINIDRGYNLILAGPGCGKTEILAERIARAYENGQVAIEDVLCLTFTNRAARGMQQRIKTRLGNAANDLFVGNIHRYCSHFLYDNAIITEDSSIIDEDDCAEIINTEISNSQIENLIHLREHINAYDNPYNDYDNPRFELYDVNWTIVNSLLDIDIHSSGASGSIKREKVNKIVSQAKNRIMQVTHILQQVRLGHKNEVFQHAKLLNSLVRYGNFSSLEDFKDACRDAHYQSNEFVSLSPAHKILSLADKLLKYKTKNNLLDFDDLLICTYDAYLKDTKKVYKRYPWVQVDEVQDLSPIQIALVDFFTDTSKDFVTLYLGDEQQAIFSFMGSSLDTLEYLKKRCKDHLFRLYKNFRSPKYLLDLYNDYAIKELNVDPDFTPKPKDNATAAKYDISLHIYNSLEQETSRIYNSILNYLLNTDADATTAILVPWNKDASEISDQLKKDKVSHFKISGTDTFQTVPMKTLLAHFNVICNEFNLIAWSRILKQTYAVDTYKEGREFVNHLRECALTPRDLMNDNGNNSYIKQFCKHFDQQTVVVFDTETTGTDVFNDDIVQIAAIKIRNGEVVPHSEFNIFLQTHKTIPPQLGEIENPLKKAYESANKVSRADGLTAFLEYIRDCTLLGHNIVNFDYPILRYNLQRDCLDQKFTLSHQLIDTLKIAKLLHPNLRTYKLSSLLSEFKLNGINSHMADDDIVATFEVAKFFRQEADRFLHLQQQCLNERLSKQVIEELNNAYKDCYWHTFNNLYEDKKDSVALVAEMEYIHNKLQAICEIRPVENFKIVMDFLSFDVISDEPNILQAHLFNHLLDLSTYREGDLCDSPSFKEKLFISTVHKAKGLEFDNVIVMRTVTDRYPSFAHKTPEEQDEDKRLLYVAMSRAKKRLIVSGADSFHMFQDSSSPVLSPYIEPIVKHFCVRFQLYANSELVINAEIFRGNLCLISNGKNVKKCYEFSSLQPLYTDKQNLQNPLALRAFLINNFCDSNAYQKLSQYLEKYGISSWEK